MVNKSIIVVLVILISSIKCFAQFSNLRSKTYNVTDTIQIDSVPIIPESIIVSASNKTLSKNNYIVNYNNSTLIFKQTISDSTINISYRIFNPLFTSVIYHKTKTTKKDKNIIEYEFPHTNSNSIFSGSDIEKSGSISRGFTIGNNQDVTMNSNLNLQLSGKLSNNLSLAASITDSNIPIQPEGNTQQLQDFDKIFIQIFNKHINLIFGDYNLNKPQGIFLNIHKKLQGVKFSSTNVNYKKKPKLTYKNTVAAAVSKAKYNRQQLTPIEGNLGPYKLIGANNERFIIVISGSEKVYINGELKKRGQSFDYTINYNSGEITFTPINPITADMRIFVEFEYSEKNYNRYVFADFASFTKGNTKMWINVMNESDSKNQPVDQNMTDAQREILSSVGDSIQNAFTENVTEESYDNDFTSYAKHDTIINGTTYSIYYFSTNPDSSVYRLGFSFVGNNKGNYIEENGLINGKIYKWISPINGVPQGNYEPVKLISAPKSHQLISGGFSSKFGKIADVSCEIAYSHYDINTFSSKDKSNDNGMGINISGTIWLTNDSANLFEIQNSYRMIHKNFKEFERYKSTEFERNWNLPTQIKNTTQHFASSTIVYNKKSKIRSSLGCETVLMPDLYTGIKAKSNTSIALKNINVNANISYLKSELDTLTGNFYRQKIEINIPINKINTGIKHNGEINYFNGIITKLESNSYRFADNEVFFRYTQNKNLYAEIKGTYRIDDRAYLEKIKPLKESKGISFISEIKSNKNSRWKFIANYRNVKIKNDSLKIKDLPENTISGRVENRSVWFKGIIRSSTYYEVNTGMESKKKYTYIATQPGQGNYVWIDRNNNQIKEVNEFEIAQIAAEGNYIRMYVPTNDYMSVYANKFKQSFNINFRKWQNSKKKSLKFISRFSNQFSFSINQKSIDSKFNHYSNPFHNTYQDSMLVQSGKLLNNTLSFNKTNRKWGLDFMLNSNLNKSLMSNGIETQKLDNIALYGRWNITPKFTFQPKVSLGTKQKLTSYFVENNYKLKEQKIETTLRFQPNNNIRIELLYKYEKKQNSSGEEHSESNDGGVSLQYAAPKKSNVVVTGHFINVKFNGLGNNSMTYEMLNGLQKGENYTWELTWNKQLSKSFQLSIQYNGRAGSKSNTIHIGSMRVSALF